MAQPHLERRISAHRNPNDRTPRTILSSWKPTLHIPHQVLRQVIFKPVLWPLHRIQKIR